MRKIEIKGKEKEILNGDIVSWLFSGWELPFHLSIPFPLSSFVASICNKQRVQKYLTSGDLAKVLALNPAADTEHL